MTKNGGMKILRDQPTNKESDYPDFDSCLGRDYPD